MAPIWGAGERLRPLPLLDPAGARVILGPRQGADGLAEPIAPAAGSLFGPRGACLTHPNGPLIVCDTGHHRLLVWQRAPTADHAPADLVIGQRDFRTEGRNGRGPVSATSLNVPTGVASDGRILAVADAWNHRVLLWHSLPTRPNQPADVVLGQADFSAGLANRGGDRPTASTLNWCYGVAIVDGRLIVADTGNRRVLIWDRNPAVNGAPADLVLGQNDFTTRDENAGASPGAVGMRWPHGIAFASGRMLVSDAGNNRVMVWQRLPVTNGAACDFVLGQSDLAAVDHNQAAYYPTATAMNMPYGLAVHGGRLLVADTASSRLVGFDMSALSMGAAASHLAGQRTFADKGDNRWGFPRRDSLCWPYSVSACGTTTVIADSGNNRVLLWEAAA
ncbi:MAG: NHL repeat-containing protein [Hyphomicrobium sp.]